MARVLFATVLTMLALGPAAIIFFSARAVYRHPEKGGRWLPVTCGLGVAVLVACTESIAGALMLGGCAVAIPLLRYLRRHEGMLVRRSWPLWAAAVIVGFSLAVVYVGAVVIILSLIVTAGDFPPPGFE